MMAAHGATSSSSVTYKWDVFLSFYGKDTRLSFISYLYHSLHQSGIHAFIDDEFIGTGENITPALLRSIEESRIAIIVFSENYANSTFCLEELAKILECFKEESRLIYPVFYYVDPSELRRPRGSYAEALARQEERFKDNRHQVEKWRLALSQAADLKGCHLQPMIAREQECITRITNEVAKRINQKPLYVPNYPVGLVSRVKEVISCLDLWSTEEIKMIGIWGAGGIGKSTIARAVYNSIADNFEALCFLSNVRKQSKVPNGLSHLQERLLCKLVMEKDLKLGDYYEGIPIIERRLSKKKILLILDDVDKSDQLEALAGSCSWFGCGSRIIITTRNKQLLVSHDVKIIYDVKELDGQESLKLLSWYAFKNENVNSSYMEVCNRAIQYSCGFPLALEVIGSNLRGKGVNHWSSALDQFQSIPHKRVFDALKLTYDTLGEFEKQVFLDLACFFNGEKLANVYDTLLSVRGIQLEYAIEMLIDKSLIKIEGDRLTMHDLIEDVGKEIVRQESYEPGERSRLWFYQDILHVLQQDTGTSKVEVIILDLPESLEVQWSGEELMKMKNLKMLVIRKACFSECPKDLPNSLRWLEWKGYPFKFLPFHMRPTELVYLDLSGSYCQLLHPFDLKFHNLGRMNLRNCKFLQQIPDLSRASNLRQLWLDGCTNLIEIHDSVGCLNKLRELSAMWCKNLKILPSCLRLTSLKHLNLFGCSSLERFPEIPIMMEAMQTLDLDRTAITELPSSICNLIGLEMLNMEECRNLTQLPASICKLPNLWKLTADFCEGMSHFKMCDGDGDEASLDCSAIMSLKMTHLYFSNCNLTYDSLAFCLPHFPNMVHLDLSCNNFTVLPKCIKEYHNLKFLLLDNCKKLQHIGGMPPNLEKFSAICCTSLTKLSKSKVLKRVFNFKLGKRNFILPEKKIPERLHYYCRGSFMSFWVRSILPTTFLWILVKDDQDYVNKCKFSVHINDTKLDISSEWLLLSTIKTDHIFICDMQSIIHSSELPLGNKWNQVKVSIESKTQEIKGEKEIHFGVHVCNLQNNFRSIQFVDPRRFVVDHNLLQKEQEQQCEELEEYMNQEDASNVTVPAQELHMAASAQFRRPYLNFIDDTQERRDNYLELCVPLHKAALKGDWRAAKQILDQHPTLAHAALTKGWATVLHVAAGENHVHLVEELVNMMDPQDLELQDANYNTAFCVAAATGNVQIVEIMLRKNSNLPTIRGDEGLTPLHMAALQGQSEMAWHLYPLTVHLVFRENFDWIILLFHCVNSEIYDLALEVLKQNEDLAFERDRENNETILHILAGKRLKKSSWRQTQQLQLVKKLWSIFLTREYSVIMATIRVPSLTFKAVEVGNFEFLAELISTFPDLLWEVDERNRIHVAVSYRYAYIFNLIHDIGTAKDFIASSEDAQDNGNLLHVAARLAPKDRLNLVSGEALQMTHELLWFEEVKKIVPPSLIEEKNIDGLTPRQLFTKEHEELLSKAKLWMKKTAEQFMVVSTLIATAMFIAAFRIPGGINDMSGNLNYLTKPSFLVFAISDATAMISSSTSILIFLSILISRYAEDDFRRALPLKLIFGLVALFFSIICMMIAFGSAFFIMYDHGSKWVPNFIAALAFIPITLFAFPLFPLWSDIVYTVYFCRNIFRPSKHMLYYEK